MLRDAGVRSKLFAVLAIPTILLVLATSWLVAGQVSAAREAGQVAALTDVAIQVNRVVHSLQLERSTTLEWVQDPTAGNHSAMLGQRRFTDSQLATLRDVFATSPINDMSDAIKTAAGRSVAAHAELPKARASIEHNRYFAAEADTFYGRIIGTDLQLPGILATSSVTELAQRLQAYGALSASIEYAAHERDLVELAHLRGRLDESGFAQAAALVFQQRDSLAQFQRYAPAGTFDALQKALLSGDNTQLDASRRALPGLLKGGESDLGVAADWVRAANSRINTMVNTESQLVSDIDTTASNEKLDQEHKALIFATSAAFGLVAAALLAYLLAKRITRPLRRLTDAAGEIGEALPRMVERMQTPGEGPGVAVDHIAVESRDEIGQLAAAFNTVNDVTVRVAHEQAALRASIAEMFVNVARRNQVLLGRQLSQIDAMETSEEDPDVLQKLFRLDHLATRMRRNAESLLVLAGIDSTRRLRRALPLSDVIRTAVGEIEAYDRIDLSIGDDTEVTGRHALTVAHLIAEVLENATHFSNPGTRVVVATAKTPGGVDVTVTDYGLGMSDTELAEANDKIANPPVAEIAVSQRLGLYVVGRLAKRLGASAELKRGRSAGTVVTVHLPVTVFEGLSVTEAPAPDEPALEAAETPAPSPFAAPLDGPVAELAEYVAAAAASSVPEVVEAPEAVVADAPVVEEAVVEEAAVEEAAVEEAAVEEAAVEDSPVAEEADETPKRRGLLPRRNRRSEPVAEPVAVEPVAVEPVAEVEPVDVVEPLVVAEPVLEPVADAEPGAVEPGGIEPVAEEPVAEVEPEVVPADEPVAEAPVVPAERGRIFGIRRRGPSHRAPEKDAPVAVPEVAELPAPRHEAAQPEPVVEPVAVEPVAVEPVAAPAPPPAPEPVVPITYAPAIDVLPSRPARGRRRAPVVAPAKPAHHEPAKHEPAHQVPAPVGLAPVAPVPDLASFTPTPASHPARAAVETPPVETAPFETSPFETSYALAPFAAPVVPAVPARPQPAYATASPPVGPPLETFASPYPVVPDADLASSALSELRGLYEPSFTPVAAPVADGAGLTRRTRRAETVAPEEAAPAAPRRTRNPAEVRGMLSGFRAGVERGRTTHDDSDVPQTDPSHDAPTS